MAVLSKFCGQALCQAAVITSDARSLNVRAFCKHFGIAEPKQESDLEAFDKERQRVMEPLGHYMGNLPAGLTEDSLLVLVYGPRVKRTAITRYVMGPEGPVFEKTAASRDSQVHMLRPWWQ